MVTRRSFPSLLLFLGVGEVGEKAVGAQVALVDEKQVTPADVGNNFFLYKEDIGKTRAAVSVYGVILFDAEITIAVIA